MEVNKLYVTENAKVNFVKGLLRAALADGVLEEGEDYFLNHLMVGLGLSDERREEILTAAKLDPQSAEAKAFFKIDFATLPEKMYLLEEVVQVSGQDEEYSDREKAVTRELARELGVSEKAVAAVEKWADAGKEWQKQGEALLNFAD